MVWSKTVPKVSCRHGPCLPDDGRRPHTRPIKQPAINRQPPQGWPANSEYTDAYFNKCTAPQQWQQRQKQKHQGGQCMEEYTQQPEHTQEEICVGLCRQKQQLQYQNEMRHCYPVNTNLCVRKQQKQNFQAQKRTDPGTHHKQATGAHRSFELYDPTPEPLLDKHYRGGTYRPGDPLGTRVPEELTTVRETYEGPKRICCQEHLSNSYLPLYRYKDWVNRSEFDIWRDCNTESLVCPRPDAPTEFWDFYNEVRMGRPAKQLETSRYQTCRAIPIPRHEQFGNMETFDSPSRHYGRFTEFQMDGVTLCQC